MQKQNCRNDSEEHLQMIIDARKIYAITETAEYDYSHTNYSNYTRIATTSMAN